MRGAWLLVKARDPQYALHESGPDRAACRTNCRPWAARVASVVGRGLLKRPEPAKRREFLARWSALVNAKRRNQPRRDDFGARRELALKNFRRQMQSRRSGLHIGTHSRRRCHEFRSDRIRYALAKHAIDLALGIRIELPSAHRIDG